MQNDNLIFSRLADLPKVNVSEKFKQGASLDEGVSGRYVFGGLGYEDEISEICQYEASETKKKVPSKRFED